MSFCLCRFILAALVIVFAWWDVEWANIALTIIGALLVILAFKKDFCCMAKKPKPAKKAAKKPAKKPARKKKK